MVLRVMSKASFRRAEAQRSRQAVSVGAPGAVRWRRERRFIKFDDGKLTEEVLPRQAEVFRRSTHKDLHPGDSADHQASVSGKLFGRGRNAELA